MTSKETVLITGCSDDGIGYGLAVQFQKRGYHVFATARTVEKMSKLKGLPNVMLLPLDVVEPAHIKAAVEAVTKETGGTLNYLISNAGRNHFMPILDEDLDTVRALFDVNVFGPMALTKAFAPLIIKAKGSFAFVTSISGYINVPWMGTYAATKRGIELIAETLRLEVEPFGVNVIEIVTGAVKTLGQSYFSDYALPADSLYKSVEASVKSRAQGNDGLPRMPLEEYSVAVTDEIINRTPGKFWYGQNADLVKKSTTATAIPQSAMDAGAIMCTGLDEMAKEGE
ncbi:putative hydroxybutyrate dehydrogenase [Ophiobolus disseminans]|uniref:Putative hydroxybutyrate dehydrogenase n=1 Tax=Ophiobolus disseminans TaxID=1469910 RepID=A0A6A6ZEF0_9PLEO|nr:putative hydroxybutyrate dehydrogenase [Ophiobolus disseminans]